MMEYQLCRKRTFKFDCFPNFPLINQNEGSCEHLN